MKLLFIGFLVVSVFVPETPAIPLLQYNNSQLDGWLVPKVDGTFFWMTREQFEKEYNQKAERHRASVKYYLYTRHSPDNPENLYFDDTNSLAKSSFDKDRPTKFIVHGWRQNYGSDFNLKIRRALLKVGDFNVINVDWSSASGLINYASSVSAIPNIGKSIASFIDFLNESVNMPFESLTLIGFSLGAHACGYAGKNVKRGRVNHIIGLDPAGPLYDYSDCSKRLCSTDAVFVESIQTNALLLGFLQPIGKATYYPNGGTNQPGCRTDWTGVCSHFRSYMYYSEALLRNNFVALKCTEFRAAVVKKCDKAVRSANMGSPGSHLNDGCYYVPVNNKPLFGTG
ncbi:phospholipase A1-like [Eupeodes corollae]|uniref:phospholipase A1-like n=1 Tax=Eupeodes corollae TaxID=290404 RepID=UPI00248FF244|nr:phospholipase A1-like [Eupeodes corollae]